MSMYNPPDQQRAMQLFEEIKEFLQSCGGHYAALWGHAGEDEHILICIVTGQFSFKKGCFFCCWWMVTDDGIDNLKQHIRPSELTCGDRMWVLECGIKSDLSALRKRMRRTGKQGIYWHRVNKGLKDFPRQQGVNNGR